MATMAEEEKDEKMVDRDKNQWESNCLVTMILETECFIYKINPVSFKLYVNYFSKKKFK